MRFQLLIQKTIPQDLSESSVSKLKDYWSRRGFKFADDHTASLSAKRGSIWWNPITYNMARLATDLTISPGPSNQISITMTICTMWQIITEWNRKYFDLEMETCESFLQSGDLREAEWKTFNSGHRKANLLWTLTLGTCGCKLPPLGRMARLRKDFPNGPVAGDANDLVDYDRGDR